MQALDTTKQPELCLSSGARVKEASCKPQPTCRTSHFYANMLELTSCLVLIFNRSFGMPVLLLRFAKSDFLPVGRYRPLPLHYARYHHPEVLQLEGETLQRAT